MGKSRKSIADMMDIAPDYANIEAADGSLEQVDPDDVAVGSVIVVKPGERVPIDGVIVEGATQLDTAALTGESVPRQAGAGDDVISGCINITGLIKVRTAKPFGESTVARVLELVENASEKKAHTENFITRFARVYTPAVTGAAALLAVVGGFVTGAWSDWILRGLTFLVVSCPCALVISVPLSFFGGIGGASKIGVLIKGSNYLEALAEVDTVVLDKTGTLTKGTFKVVATHPAPGFTAERLLELAAHAEAFSDHPIAVSVREAYSGELDPKRVADSANKAGHGVSATVDGKKILVGNEKLLAEAGIEVVEARITYLAYAPEIAAVMLQRQQASAIIDARKMIVDGAVGMVEMALERLNENKVVELDDERKAAMVSNLLVVLCGNRDAQPIVNSGSLY